MKPKALNQPEMRQVEKRLAEVVERERRGAIWFTVLTVLCTPFLVLLAGFVALGLVCFIADQADYEISIKGIYTCVNLFLAGLVGFVSRYSDPRDREFELDPTLLAGVVVLLALLYLTYFTSLMDSRPRLFGVVYTCVAFLVTGLLGHVYMKVPVAVDFTDENPFKLIGLAVFGYIAMSYGQIVTGSWLWFPPDANEICVAAWILCKLAADEDGSFEVRSAEKRILNLLSRLKLIQIRGSELQLTLRGQDFVTAASRDEYAVE